MRLTRLIGISALLLILFLIPLACIQPSAGTEEKSRAIAEGFAIYLTRDDIPPEKMEMLSHIDLADQPVISIQDIISYDALTHEIKLTGEAFERIANLEVPVRGKSFLVCVDRTPLYWGAFWTPFSSMLFGGVTIWKPLGDRESRTITIERGFPQSTFYQEEDPRNNTKVLQSLEQSGKLINRLSID